MKRTRYEAIENSSGCLWVFVFEGSKEAEELKYTRSNYQYAPGDLLNAIKSLNNNPEIKLKNNELSPDISIDMYNKLKSPESGCKVIISNDYEGNYYFHYDRMGFYAIKEFGGVE